MSVGHTEVTAEVTEGTPVGPCGEHDCGIREVLDRIGDRWTVLVIVELSHGVRRFRELQRAIPGISQRMLTVTTRRLLRDGLVEHTVHPTAPPQVEYSLTTVGRSLASVVSALADWADAHKDRMAESRRTWDTEHPEPVG